MRLRKALEMAVALLALYGAWQAARRCVPSSIDYRGEKIKLSKFYLSFEDYKNDPDNIAPSENARVQQLVSLASIPRRFKDLNEAVSAVFDVKFPGYGAGGVGSRKADGDATLAGFEVEIPRSDKTRYFVFRCSEDGCVLIDDFVPYRPVGIVDFQRKGRNIIYTTSSGGRKFARAMLPPVTFRG